MSEVHRDGDTSLHVRDDGVVELRTTNAFGVDPVMSSSERSINQVCRRYADRTGTDFQVAAAAVLDALETTAAGGGGR